MTDRDLLGLGLIVGILVLLALLELAIPLRRAGRPKARRWRTNLSLPSGADRWLRRLIVTPDMHRVHHFALPAETDSNFGTFPSGWDRLFGTYGADAQQPLTIGLAGWQDARPTQSEFSLWLPFRRT